MEIYVLIGFICSSYILLFYQGIIICQSNCISTCDIMMCVYVAKGIENEV